MRTADLHLLPRFADGLTFLYVERARVEQDTSAIILIDETGRVPVPVAALSVLLLGPGTTITHAAVTSCADVGCSILFLGEASVRFYASGLGETRRSANLLHQATVWADMQNHLAVVRRMYTMRFATEVSEALTLDQIRGMEGARVRESYARFSRETGVPWNGRSYNGDWAAATPVNRALSTANACLYGLCHAAIVSIGMAPGLGFVHTGKSLAFVYDIADLYKTEITVPLAFEAAAASKNESDVRRMCRDAFRRTKLIERVVPDVQRCLGLKPEAALLVDTADDGQARLWDGEGAVQGARNYALP